MNRIEILKQLKSIIQENLEIEVSQELKETDRLYEDLTIDSIMVLQLIVYIEEAFEVAIPEEEVDPEVFQTVGSLVSFIEPLKGLEV